MLIPTPKRTYSIFTIECERQPRAICQSTFQSQPREQPRQMREAFCCSFAISCLNRKITQKSRSSPVAALSRPIVAWQCVLTVGVRSTRMSTIFYSFFYSNPNRRSTVVRLLANYPFGWRTMLNFYSADTLLTMTMMTAAAAMAVAAVTTLRPFTRLLLTSLPSTYSYVALLLLGSTIAPLQSVI